MVTEKSKGIRAVFFDLDDTLVATIKPKWEQHKFIAREHYKKILTDDELRQHWGKPLSLMLQLIYGTEDINGAFENVALHRHKYPKVLFEKVVEDLLSVRSSGKLTGLITAHRREGVDLDFASLGIPGELFDYIQTEDDTQFHKPDKRVFDPAITWLGARGLKPDQAVYIGDGLHDMKAAVGAGLNFIGVETGLVTAEQFAEEGAISVMTINHAIPLLMER